MGLTINGGASGSALDELRRRTQCFQRMAYCLLECAESVRGIKQAIRDEDETYGAQLWNELTHEEQIALWVAPTKGGIFTTRERQVIRERYWRYAQALAEESSDD